MAFQVVYVADGELNTVKKVKYVDRIKNFAQLSQPYNKMLLMNIPAIEGVYDLDWVSPDETTELLSIVVTCSGYGENDYYYLFKDNEKWFDTWFPTEVKEGLYIGTSSYVYELDPQSEFKLRFVNASGTAKKVWIGFRLLKEKSESSHNIELIDVNSVSTPLSDLGIPGEEADIIQSITTDYTLES